MTATNYKWAMGLLLSATAFGQTQLQPLSQNPALPANVRPAQLMGVEVEEHLTLPVDLNLEFIAENGYPVKLASYFHQGRPVILNLVYYNCPMLCSLILNGQVEALREIPWTPGKEYEVVTISINPEESFDIARQKRAMYLGSYERPAPGWHFLVDKDGNAKKLAEMVGFHYRYDPRRGQYAHPSAIMVLTPEGRMARYLYGIRFRPRDLRFALAEASEGRATMALEKFLLFCYHYDPQAGSYVLFATNVMRAGGILTVILIALYVRHLFQEERARAAGAPKEGLA